MIRGAIKDSDRAAPVRGAALRGEASERRAQVVQVVRRGDEGAAADASAEGAAAAFAPAPGASAEGAAAAFAPAPSREYLGPGRVTVAEHGGLVVELPDGAAVPVEMALALPYEPVVEDTLLVIGREERYYAIGVLHGAGRTVLSLHGDVALHAREGALSLSGDKGVEIRGPEIEVQAGKVRMVADAVVQKFNSMYQRVSALLKVHAHEAHTVVDKTSFTKAQSSTLLTEETVTVNGKQILLG